jgi:hypothetical protein
VSDPDKESNYDTHYKRVIASVNSYRFKRLPSTSDLSTIAIGTIHCSLLSSTLMISRQTALLGFSESGGIDSIQQFHGRTKTC